jgi:hypothetical protein
MIGYLSAMTLTKQRGGRAEGSSHGERRTIGDAYS